MDRQRRRFLGLMALATAALSTPALAQQPQGQPRPGQPMNLAPGAGGAASGQPVQPPRVTARAGQTLALDANQRQVIDRANAYFNSVQFMTGDFVQVGPDGTRFTGKVHVQKPGRMRFQYNPPSTIELIADGSAVAVRDTKLATQDIYPIGQTPLRFLLSDQVNLARDSSVVAVMSDNLFSTVVLEEKQAFGGTHRVMLMFNAQDMTLRQWTITDPQGFDTTVAISNVDTTKRPDARLFRIDYTRMLQ
jgi:outer membrane lipoprotein-sorting protein